MTERSSRLLSHTGAVDRDRRTLQERADQAARSLWADIQGKQIVLWLDNWYWEVYQADPETSNASQNVSAWAVLVVDNLTGSRLVTRSSRITSWTGHSTLLQLFGEVDSLGRSLTNTVSELGRRLTRVDQCPFQREDVRVPLDVKRPRIRSLQWQPWALSQLKVSSNLDMLKLMHEARAVQAHSGQPMPLLVDENVHYRLARLLYGSSYHPWDMAGYLRQVPVLYGVWHPYKHCLTVVYRAFFPVLAHLEAVGAPVVGSKVRAHRKVLYMEKVFAALFLTARDVQLQLESKIATVGSHVVPSGTDVATTSNQVPGSSETGSRLTHELLLSVQRLLQVYVPALFILGHKVRQCTWEGRPDGVVKGDTARDILRQCLLLQAHLQADWTAREEYVRSLGVALLMWQPWMDTLPGCCFVEESCEALLSRMASQCRTHTTLRGFDNTNRLFQSLPPPSGDARGSRGCIRQSLVQLYRQRLRCLISQPSDRPYPKLTTSSTGTWVAKFPHDWKAPASLREASNQANWVRCIQGAFALLTAPKEPTPEVTQWLDANVAKHVGPVPAGVRNVWTLRDQWMQARGIRIRTQTGSRLDTANQGTTATDTSLPIPITVHPNTEDDATQMSEPVSSVYQVPDDQEDVSQGYVSSGDTDGLSELGLLEVLEQDMLLIEDMGDCEQ